MVIQRWTDEMLDELASSVSEMRESMTEMRESMTEMRESMTEMREGMTEMRESIDNLRVTSQALLQLAAQNQQELQLIKQRQAESDQRFNILLEEVRYLIRNNQGEKS